MAAGKDAAVDLGVRISASLSIEGVPQALHFEGRELLKDWDALGREIAREQHAIAGTRGGDAEKCPHSRAISRLYQKRRLRLEHGWKGIAKTVAETCVEHGVGTVHLGYPSTSGVTETMARSGTAASMVSGASTGTSPFLMSCISFLRSNLKCLMPHSSFSK